MPLKIAEIHVILFTANKLYNKALKSYQQIYLCKYLISEAHILKRRI
jgi:hypothetical protein